MLYTFLRQILMYDVEIQKYLCSVAEIVKQKCPRIFQSTEAMNKLAKTVRINFF